MHLTMSARHMELTDALKAHVESRLDKLKGHFDRVIDANVVLSVEKHRHIAEVTLNANGVRMHSEGASEDMYASIDSAVERLHKQIHKFKDRVGRYVPVKISEAAVLAEEPALVGAGDGVAEAVAAPAIVRERLTLAPLGVTDAIAQLDLLQDNFMVFVNADTLQVNVVYAKGDGSYGLIEPQY